jgi:hypothetical protein
MSATAATTHVLLAVHSQGLARVLEHLLGSLPHIQTSRVGVATATLRSPDVIVASARMMGSGTALSPAALRRACPRARLIMITDREWWGDEVGVGPVDASFDEEDVVRCFLPIVQILAAGTVFPVAAD